jgi:hypothetical protein
MEEDYGAKLYSEYSAQREKLDAASLEAAGRYDKAVLAVSTGALALSVTFIEKIAPNPQHWTLFFLVPGWFLLLTTIILQLLALSSSHNATREQISILDQQYTKYFLAEDPAKLVEAGWTEADPTNRFVALTNRYNVYSQIALYVGIACILAFSSINICFKKEAISPVITPLKPIVQKIDVTIMHKYIPSNKTMNVKKARVTVVNSETLPVDILPNVERGELIMTCTPTPAKPTKSKHESSYTPPVNKLPPPPPPKK